VGNWELLLDGMRVLSQNSIREVYPVGWLYTSQVSSLQVAGEGYAEAVLLKLTGKGLLSRCKSAIGSTSGLLRHSSSC
jgi:hypothetical protein